MKTYGHPDSKYNERTTDLALRFGISPETIRRAVAIGKLNCRQYRGINYMNEEEFIRWRAQTEAWKQKQLKRRTNK